MKMLTISKKMPVLLMMLIALFSVLNMNAQTVTRKVLFLGNSYTYVNNLPQITANIASSMGDSLVFDSNTPGGYTLDNHFQDSTSVQKIRAGGWDYVIMQEQSQIPSWPGYQSSGAYYISLLTRKYNPCARNMFYMTWGRKNGDQGNCPVIPEVCSYEGMDTMLRNAYIEMGILWNSEVSPVGAVWHYIRDHFPTIELYQADESHPSEAGTYAAACCFYAAIFKKDPSLITYDFTIPPADAASIRSAAKAVVFDSLPDWDFVSDSITASFDYSIGTGTNEVILINRSYHADTYIWDFGDGTFSTDTNPTHNFVADGTYTIKLTGSRCDFSQTFESTDSIVVTFCPYNPSIIPDSLFLCPGAIDTLHTQAYDSYQWLDENNDPIPNETSQGFIPVPYATYSVQTTLNGCTEISPQVYVYGLSIMVVYYVHSYGPFHAADTACVGDTMYLVLEPNKPDGGNKIVQWYKDGQPIPGVQHDTLMILTSGIYSVTAFSNVCPDVTLFESDPFSYTFIRCNIGIEENDVADLIHLYPNPADDNVHMKVKETLIGTTYQLFDIYGRVVTDGVFEKEINNLRLENFSSGIYFLEIGKANKHTIKVIKG